MNSELPSDQPKIERTLDEAFRDKPHLRARLIEIADMVERLVAQGCSADEAEAQTIEQIRKLGHSTLSEWAEKAEASSRAQACAQDPTLRPYRKKKP